MLVKICHVEGRQKLGDRWEQHPYIIQKKQMGVPLYVVRPEGGGTERVVHRNLLTQCMFLPVEKGTTGDESDEDRRLDIEGDMERENGEGILDEDSVTRLCQEEEDDILQETDLPRRNPPRNRRPPNKLSLESQVVKEQHDQWKIQRGRELWQQAK